MNGLPVGALRLTGYPSFHPTTRKCHLLDCAHAVCLQPRMSTRSRERSVRSIARSTTASVALCVRCRGSVIANSTRESEGRLTGTMRCVCRMYPYCRSIVCVSNGSDSWIPELQGLISPEISEKMGPESHPICRGRPWSRHITQQNDAILTKRRTNDNAICPAVMRAGHLRLTPG